MIKQINIENYQSWKEAELIFHPGINLIIGESDEGKSAIMRALTWPINNRPLGNEFINDSDPDNICAVEIENHIATIARATGQGVNLYYLNDDEFRAFGRNPPEEIIQTFKISDLNIQEQKDNFFLFNDSAPDVGRYLNNIIDLTVIDRSLSHANKRIKRTNNIIATIEKQKTEFEEEIKGTDWVIKADKDLKRIEKIETEQERSKQIVSGISYLILSIGEVYEEIDKADKLLKFKVDLKEIEGWIKDQEERREKAFAISRLITLSKKIEEDILASSTILKFNDKVEELIELDSVTADLGDEADELELLLTNITVVNTQITTSESLLEDLETEFHKLMPESCPLCGEEKK